MWPSPPTQRASVAAAVLAILLLAALASSKAHACTFDNDGRVKCFESTERTVKKAGKRRASYDANGNRAALATIRASNGRTAKVASRYASQFQSFIDDLESEGYRIDFMGGWRSWGTCRSCDAHPGGRAIDINQTGRNRVTRRLPSNVTAIAARHGICHGAIWGNPDRGHFEIASKSRATSCHQFANRGWPRIVHRIETP